MWRLGPQRVDPAADDAVRQKHEHEGVNTRTHVILTRNIAFRCDHLSGVVVLIDTSSDVSVGAKTTIAVTSRGLSGTGWNSSIKVLIEERSI